MSVWYINEKEENNNLTQKIKNFFNIIDIKFLDNKIFIELPLKTNSKKKVIKIAKKVNLLLYKNRIQAVALSKSLYQNEILYKMIYSQNVNVLDGRRLFLFLSNKIIKKICEYAGTNKENIEISILVNENNERNISNIIEIAKDVKRLNIITTHIEKFKNVQDYLFNEFGIMAKLSNNKKKDLINSNIILNIDFAEDMINKFTLPHNAVIINIKNNTRIISKKFNGINIIDYDIIINDKYKIEQFEDKIAYESIIYNASFNEAKQKILTDNIAVSTLLGKNGKISKKEFELNVDKW